MQPRGSLKLWLPSLRVFAGSRSGSSRLRHSRHLLLHPAHGRRLYRRHGHIRPLSLRQGSCMLHHLLRALCCQGGRLRSCLRILLCSPAVVINWLAAGNGCNLRVFSGRGRHQGTLCRRPHHQLTCHAGSIKHDLVFLRNVGEHFELLISLWGFYQQAAHDVGIDGPLVASGGICSGLVSKLLPILCCKHLGQVCELWHITDSPCGIDDGGHSFCQVPWDFFGL
mmetsp:Transcript_25852/g.70121  ORF Transcript_25852/g.70121 Transcript_25852/m.70121 type:complete len:224 (-) Transcript_25852:400-1071(-)